MSKWKSKQIENFCLSLYEMYQFEKGLIVILLADVLVNAIMPFPNVILAGRIVDSIQKREDFENVVFLVLLLFGLNLVLSALAIVFSKLSEYSFLKLSNKLDNDINEKCMNIDYEQFNDSSLQDKILMINQAIKGNNFFTSITIFFQIVSRVITLLGIIAIMTGINAWLVAAAAIIIVLQASVHYIRLRIERVYRSDSVHDQRNTNYVSQIAKDVKYKKDIIAFDMRRFILDKIAVFQKKMLLLTKRRNISGGILELLIYTLSVIFQISAYILMGQSAIRGEITIGDFTTGVASMISFMSASSFIAAHLVSFNDGIFYIKQYNSFLRLTSKYSEKYEFTLEDLNIDKFEIEFQNVSFRYPNSTTYVLKDINLKIDSGEKLGIVGFNGAGKTSFVLLLARMYDPTEGTILLNKIDIKRIRYEDYQKIFSIVNQDFSLMAFSLLNNIAIKDEVPEEDYQNIVRLFEAHDMENRLNKMYRGLNTPVTKELFASGIDLSGGERQKLAIIRALYKNSPIFILDEPTASLDPVSEMDVYNKIKEMAKNHTTVFISHRIYSTRFCDKIAVFEKGEIVECGSFEELIELRGRYYEFFQTQAANYR